MMSLANLPSTTDGTHAQAAVWRYLSHIVIRRTGFPFEWLDHLTTPESAALAAELARRQHALDIQIETLLHTTFPAVVRDAYHSGDRALLRALSRLRRRVGQRTLRQSDLERWTALPIALSAELAALVEAQQRLRDDERRTAQTLRTEIEQAHAALRQIVGDSFFQEALFLSNPDIYRNTLEPFLRQPERIPDTLFERKLLSYVQRFCAKNDTASFFGPLNYGHVSATQTEPLLIETEGVKYRQREIFIGFWVADQLAEQISAEPELQPLLRPRLHPLCRWEGATVYFASRDRRARLSAQQQAIIAAVDGARTVAEIATLLGLPVADVQDEIGRLSTLKVLICRLEVPSTIFHPFSYLQQLLDALPATWSRRDYWRAQLQRFEELRRAFRSGDLAERQRLLAEMDQLFTTLTGVSSRRAAGQTYADRLVLYEDCAGTFSRLEFGAAFFAELQRRIQPILDLCLTQGSLLWEFYQQVGRAVFAELSPDGQPVPYARFIEAVQQRQRADRLPSSSPALDQFAGALHELVAARSDGHIARLSAADIQPWLDTVPLLKNSHVSPDVMLAAPDLERLRRGEYQVVLGEVHQVVYVWGSQLFFYEQRAEAEAEVAAHLAQMPEYDGIATILNERRHKGLLYDAFPGTWIEVFAIPGQDSTARAPLAVLEVALVDGGLVLRDGRDGRTLRLYTAGDEQLHLWTVALPRVMPVVVRLGSHTPRIEINGAVYQRERWQLPTSAWGPQLARLSALDLLQHTQALRQRYELPRRVYVHVASEPKPFYIDLESSLSLRLLQHLLTRNGQVTLTEMLPAPDGLWLADAEGHYCCEFRMAACRY